MPNPNPLPRNDTRPYLLWGSAVLLAAALRLFLAWQWRDVSVLTADEPGYDNLARGLLAGDGLTWPGRVPGYPVWLAAIYAVTGGGYPTVRYVQALVGTVTVGLTGALGQRLYGPWGGALAALLAAVDFVLVRQAVRLLSEALYTPLVVVVALLLLAAAERPTRRRWAAAGFAVGVSNLVRPNLLLFPVWLLLPLWRERPLWRRWAVLTAAAVVTVLPWVARNYARYGAVYPLQTSNAILWQGSPEYFRLLRDDGYTYLDVWNKVIYPPDGSAPDPGSVAGDRWWTQRALRSIAAEPGVYLRFAAEKLATYWIGDPNADWNDTVVFNYRALRQVGLTRAAAVQLWLWRAMPAAAALAVVITWRDRRRLWPLHALLAYNMVLHAATHAEARLSEPLHPLLLVLLAGALVTVGRRRIRPNPPPPTADS